jgi:hypothetical protein
MKMSKFQNTVNNQSVAALKEMAVALSNDFRDGADFVFEAVLARLVEVMPENEFIAFSEAL